MTLESRLTIQPAELRFRVLGPVEIGAGIGPSARLLRPAQRPAILLASLVLSLNRQVSIDELVDVIWGDDLPDRPRSALQTYVSRLRVAIGDGNQTIIRTSPGGYSLHVAPEQVDLEVFRSLIAQATRATGAADRLDLLTEALDLWHGEPLAGLEAGALGREVIPRLVEERLQARELYYDARLAHGDAAGVVRELTELTEKHPTRERFWALLIAAQRVAAGPVRALETYGELARKLADLLGSAPGPELRKLQADLLAATDPASPEASDPEASSSEEASEAEAVVPRQVPVGLRNFTGRSEHLQRLHQLVAAGARLGLITGPGGVGKTSLAIQWAHEVGSSFPDGVLYADLLGYAPGTGPAEPHLVLPRFLTALGVRADNLPTTTDEQIALFRSLLADRSVLVVLDNARSTHQVRPLVASGPTCFTLVTSRNELTGLIAADEAEVVPLDVLDPEQARQLLRARIGGRRLDGDPASGEELVARCAGLPIALSLLGAQIALRPRWPLDSFVQAMSTAPLDALTTPDGTGVRAVFSWSYQQLSPPAARLFGLLAHHPGPDLRLGAAAALAGAPLSETREVLAELVAAHQLTEIAPGRYVMHDLLRSYGLELSDPADAEQAFLRLLNYLVHTGSAAALLLSPTRDPIELPAPDPAVDLSPPTTHAEALAWFESEQPNSLAVLRAAAGRADRLLWLYVWAFGDYLEYQGHPGNLEIQRLALDAAIRLDNRQWQASTRRDLGRVHMALSQWDEAIRQQELALGLVEELGDERGIAHGSLSIARVYTRTGRQQLAIEHTLRALRIYQRIGHERGAAHSLNNLGWYHALLGEYDEAMNYAQRALHSYEGISSTNGPPAALDTIAYIQAELGHLDEAIATWERVTELYRKLGSRPDLALTLTALGRTHQRAGHTDEARTTWNEALHLYESLNHPQAAELRTHLKSLEDQQP